MDLNELERLVAQRSLKDPAFRDELLRDPQATFEKYTGQKLPPGGKIHVHLQGPNDMHLVIPDRKAIEAAMKHELSDEDLEKVAGGEIFISLIVGSIIAAAGTAAAIANDQTRARQGW